MSSRPDRKMKGMADALASQSVSNYQSTSTVVKTDPAQEQEPPDRYQIVKITMYLFGITSLLPWNFFIQANDYWMFKFRNVSLPFDPAAEDKTNLQAIFSSYLAIASKVPYVCFLLVNAYVSVRLQPSKRIQWPLMAMILLFVTTTAIVFVNTDKHQTAFFSVTIAIVVAINSMCGFVQGGGTGIAGSLPKRFMQYNVNGMAVGGLLASAAQIISLVSITDPGDSAFFYFATATIFLCITFGMFRLTLKSALYNFYMSKQTSMIKNRHTPQDEVPKRISNLEIFKQIWVYALSIVFVFWVTLAVLPAVVVLVLPANPDGTIWTGRLFLPLTCFLLFNVADLASRLVAQRIAIPARFKYITLSLAMLRFVFIPLMMLCNAHPRTLPVVFDSDVDFILITVFFGFTGGYLCTIVLTQGPKSVREEHFEQAGSQLAFFLGLGLMLGSVSSYGIVKLL